MPNKTHSLDLTVEDYLETLEPRRREDATRLHEIFSEVTQLPADIWSGNMIGYGRYHYRYESGHEGDALMTGFAPRKAKISLYLWLDEAEPLLQKLGKHTHGKACVYINKLQDIDEAVLRELIAESVRFIRRTWPDSD